MSKAVRNVSTIKKKVNLPPLTIIIPAAGEGLRMKSYGPKPLLKINGYTLIQHQVIRLKSQFPDSTIILVSGYESAKVMSNSPVDIVHVENERYSSTEVVRSISLGLRAATTDRVLVVYGDLAFNGETLQYPLLDKSVLFVDNSTMSAEEVGCTVVNNYVENLLYDVPNKWAQIAYFVGEELKLLKHFAHNPANEKKFGFEILNEILNKGGKFVAATPKDIKVNDIDYSKDLASAKEILCGF